MSHPPTPREELLAAKERVKRAEARLAERTEATRSLVWERLFPTSPGLACVRQLIDDLPARREAVARAESDYEEGVQSILTRKLREVDPSGTAEQQIEAYEL